MSTMRRFPEDLREKFRVFRKLDTPGKIQDFLDGLRMNFERRGETCRSPLAVLAHGEAHCIEGALLAAAAFWYHGFPPLLLDIKTAPGDFDHVVALFRERGRWGALSKTNHAVLRYRDPVYKSVRELAMSYFHEYFLDSGRKTMRSFSEPFDLRRAGTGWLAASGNLWDLSGRLDRSPHQAAALGARLRRASPVEIKAGKITEWKK